MVVGDDRLTVKDFQELKELKESRGGQRGFSRFRNRFRVEVIECKVEESRGED